MPESKPDVPKIPSGNPKETAEKQLTHEQVEQKLTVLKAEIDVKKDKGEKLSKEDIAKYRGGIKELKNSKMLSPEQEKVTKTLEEWLDASEKIVNGQADTMIETWKSRADSYLSVAKGFGSWLLKQLAELCDNKGMLGAFKKLLVGLSHSREAEIAGLKTIPALKDVSETRLAEIRTTLNQKASEIAKARTTRGAGLPDYDLVSLVDELGKDSITDDKTLLASVDKLAETENTLTGKFQEAKAAQIAANTPNQSPAKSNNA